MFPFFTSKCANKTFRTRGMVDGWTGDETGKLLLGCPFAITKPAPVERDLWQIDSRSDRGVVARHVCLAPPLASVNACRSDAQLFLAKSELGMPTRHCDFLSHYFQVQKAIGAFKAMIFAPINNRLPYPSRIVRPQ